MARTPQINDRIYYTGDMANQPDSASVVAVFENRWGKQFTIRWDNPEQHGETTSTLMFSALSAGPGTRFHFMDEYQTARNSAMLRIQEAARHFRLAHPDFPSANA